MPVYLELSDFRASGTVYTAIDIATGQEVGVLHPLPPLISTPVVHHCACVHFKILPLT